MNRLLVLFAVLCLLFCGCGYEDAEIENNVQEPEALNFPNTVSSDKELDIDNKFAVEYGDGFKHYTCDLGVCCWYINDEGIAEIPSYMTNTPIHALSSTMSHEEKLRVKSIIISEGIEYIRFGAFEQYPNLESVTLPSTIKAIGSYAFFMCTSLKTINIPADIEFIGSRAFFGCENLVGLEYPYTAEAIAEDAFNYCPGLAWSPCPDADAFSSNNFTPSGGVVYVPGAVREIAPEGFAQEKITELYVSQGVERIGVRAFFDCMSLCRVIIPPSVTSIGEDAFTGCNDGLVIYGEYGSYAEQWAKENGFVFGLYVF